MNDIEIVQRAERKINEFLENHERVQEEPTDEEPKQVRKCSCQGLRVFSTKTRGLKTTDSYVYETPKHLQFRKKN